MYDANPQNFLSNLTMSSLGTLRNTFPVISGNTLSLSLEIPFIPSQLTYEVYNESNSQCVTQANVTELETNEREGLIFLFHQIKAEDTCTPGDFLYNFNIVNEDSSKIFTRQVHVKVISRLPDKSIQLLTSLRSLLSDDVIPKRGQVWTDLELLEYLNLAMMETNGTPTLTNFCLNSAPSNWGFLLVIGAEYHALRALYNRESRDVFSFNDDGISVDISVRSEKYMNMINHLSGTYTKMREDLKRHFRPVGRAYNSSFTDLSIRNLRPFLLSSSLGSTY